MKAATLNDLFSEATVALTTVMYGDCRDAGIRRRITLEAADSDELLQEFLSEVLYISEAENIVFCGAQVRTDGRHLSATLTGEDFDPGRHNTGTEVKGISYSGLSIREEGENYAVELLFDV
ncbi:MAG: archease [Methanoregulaceae archaeon]|nr:archease [Methanoregulaceae archaeon]